MEEGNWDRIILVNSFVVKINKHVNRFISGLEEPEKVLAFITSGGADWQPKSDFNVDALTSASHESYIKYVLPLIRDWATQMKLQKWVPNDYVLSLLFFPQVDVQTACKTIVLESDRYLTIYPELSKSFTVWPWSYPSFVVVGIILLHLSYLSFHLLAKKKRLNK